MFRLYISLLSLVALTLIACGSAEVSPTLSYYVAAQEALAADDYARAHQALQQLAQHADPALKTLAKSAAEAGDIEAVRAAFKPLSAGMLKGEVPAGYVQAYCPMADNDKGAHWIQKDGPSIVNPYFGASMLHCGVFKE